MLPTIETSVNEIMKAAWNITNGAVVPKTEDVALKNGGRLVDATYVYADLANSSKIAQSLTKEAAATIIRSFVNTATRILRNFGGEIRSFDGDRVMAIYMGDDKNWNAVRAAFAIKWAVEEVIRPAIKGNWSDGENFYNIGHRVGIDTGESLIVRGGARNNNDLISIGGAPNIAAKLSDQKTGYSTYITDRVYDQLSDDLLYLESNGMRRNGWHRLYPAVEVGGTHTTVYGSNTFWGI
ncbi:adenylate/guanylate cyclase domain-containing protein [Mycolicibacter virginiensis]|uniref:Adenylate/guanylate cyclase domain-containing protein n=1 Tax=Mycolicibacter virginiensis TaxID=1795032 RepID=A0A9X7IND0_9MYCO|nr:adenylate/guanylate cyclase domain-containing protein [Mycolicibacter virginiensis]PQM52350.1 adenylate/guanylate cyclase domain-containing protein [Mycolicibacter virginiensis]